MTDNFLSWERQAVCSVKPFVGNRIIIVKSEEIKHKTCRMTTDGYTTLCFYMFLFIFGWIAGGREAYSCNYRHYVSQCPSAPWNDHPISLTSTRHGHRFIFTCQVIAVSPSTLYHVVCAYCLLCWWIMVATTDLHLTGDEQLENRLWKVVAKIFIRQLPCNSCCEKSVPMFWLQVFGDPKIKRGLYSRLMI